MKTLQTTKIGGIKPKFTVTRLPTGGFQIVAHDIYSEELIRIHLSMVLSNTGMKR